MKNIAVLIGLLILSLNPMAKAAEPLELDLKFVTLVLPFQDLEAAYLYDIKFQKNILGAETMFFRSGRVRGTIGAGVEEGESDVPYFLGVDTELSERYFGERVKVGGWISADFDIPGSFEDKLRGGIKGSAQLW